MFRYHRRIEIEFSRICSVIVRYDDNGKNKRNIFI